MVYLSETGNEIKRGDILVSLFDWRNIFHWGIMLGSRSKYVHCTIYLGDNKEWSVQPEKGGGGTKIRPLGSDRFQQAFRLNREDLSVKIADLAEKTTVNGYNWEGIIWLGVQILEGTAKKTPNTLKMFPQSRFCSEAVTDLCVFVGYDIVPDVEDGATTPQDIAQSKLIRRL